MCGRFAPERLMCAMLCDWLAEDFDAGEENEPSPVPYRLPPTARVPILLMADRKFVPDFAR